MRGDKLNLKINEDKVEREVYLFCPMCLEEHLVSDDLECEGCGAMIPSGVMDLYDEIRYLKDKLRRTENRLVFADDCFSEIYKTLKTESDCIISLTANVSCTIERVREKFQEAIDEE